MKHCLDCLPSLIFDGCFAPFIIFCKEKRLQNALFNYSWLRVKVKSLKTRIDAPPDVIISLVYKIMSSIYIDSLWADLVVEPVAVCIKPYNYHSSNQQCTYWINLWKTHHTTIKRYIDIFTIKFFIFNMFITIFLNKKFIIM